MFHVRLFGKNRFKWDRDSINKIADYLNNLCAGEGLKMDRPDTPSAGNPPRVALDIEKASELLADSIVNTVKKDPEKTKTQARAAKVNETSSEIVLWDKGKATISDAQVENVGFECQVPISITNPGASGNEQDGKRLLWWAKLTFNANGLLTKVTAMPSNTTNPMDFVKFSDYNAAINTMSGRIDDLARQIASK